MFNLFRKSSHAEVGPGELNALLQAGKAVLVDVREADEFAAGHIAGAVSMPLSTFQPTHLPRPAGKMVILTCAAGRRSAMALDKAVHARPDVSTHLAGGMGAWCSAGLPIVRG